METHHEERRLITILAADVVGYSRLMAADESGTFARLRAHRKELIEPKSAEYHGRVVKLTGDGVLMEFGSVVDAVLFAVDVQRAMAERDAAVSEEHRIRYRIGINIGEIIVDGEDIYGDGVNVAARLEAIAEPGSIYVSRSVYNQIKGKTGLGFEDLGERLVKNIPDPVRIYRVDLSRTDTGSASRGSDAGTLSLPDKPSIAVLPFQNMSGDPEQEFFADGMAEDIITALSRYRWFFVIARNSSFTYKGRAVAVTQVASELGVRYVLEGSVRKAGNRVRLTAQLIDATTGNHIWAKRYDRELDDIFALQDDLTERIVGALEPELGKAERARAKRKHPGNLDAWDLYQRGLSHLYRYTKEELAEAQRQFRRAIEKDSQLGPAYSSLAEVYYYSYVYGHAESLSECRKQALQVARRAVELDSEDASAHCTLGRVRYMRREHEAAIPELQMALELNPSLALAHYGLGAVMVFSDRAAESLPHLGTAIRLSPHDPNMGSFLVRLADAHLIMGHYDKAIEWARKALGQTGFQWSRYAVLLSALGHLGRTEEARRVLDDVLAQRPDFSRRFVRETHLFVDEDNFAFFIEGLRKAGVPR